MHLNFLPLYNLLKIFDVNGDGFDDLLIGEPSRNGEKMEIVNDGNNT